MKILQGAFDQGIEELFSPEKLGTELVKRKLEGIGIKINKSQLSKIKKQFIAQTKNVDISWWSK